MRKLAQNRINLGKIADSRGELEAQIRQLVTPNILARYVGGDAAVIYGLMTGADLLKGRAFAVDVPQADTGQGRVIMFSNNPMYRWPNQGEFNMVFNSVLNWNDGPKPAAKVEAKIVS